MGAPLLRTVARLQYGDHAFDFQFTWQDRVLYESLTEVGNPHAVILPLAPTGSLEYATWDLVTARGASVRLVAREDGVTDMIVRTELGDGRATRIRQQ